MPPSRSRKSASGKRRGPSLAHSTSAPAQQSRAERSSRPSSRKYLSIGEHLEELRRRVISVLALLIASGVCALLFSKQLHAFLITPYLKLTNQELLLQNVYGSLEVLLKLSFMSAVSLSLPFSFYILWGFITPALPKRAAWIGGGCVMASCLLFWCGLVIAWHYLFPMALHFLFQDILLMGVKPQTTVEKYYSFLFLLHIGCGLVFQMPLLSLILGWLGIITSRWHKQNWRYIVLILLIFSAIITPPDPISQIALALLVLVLYALSVMLIWLIEKSSPS